MMIAVEVYGNKLVDLSNIKSADINLDLIAHSLSNQCRYNGHCKRFYSVAEHSVLVAAILKELDANLETQQWGLLHDAHEAFISDIIHPLKHLAESIIKIGDEIDELILPKYIKDITKVDLTQVRHADMMSYAIEKRDLLGSVKWPEGNTLPKPLPDIAIKDTLFPPQANWRFLSKASLLGVHD